MPSVVLSDASWDWDAGRAMLERGRLGLNKPGDDTGVLLAVRLGMWESGGGTMW